jgi:hypothetical protein
MLAVKRSPFSGEICSREIPVTEEQFKLYESGMLIQHAMPNISSEDREFIMTGITPEEWAKVFPPEEEIDNQP